MGLDRCGTTSDGALCNECSGEDCFGERRFPERGCPTSDHRGGPATIDLWTADAARSLAPSKAQGRERDAPSQESASCREDLRNPRKPRCPGEALDDLGLRHHQGRLEPEEP